MLCSLVFWLRSSLNLTLAYEACSVSSCFMNSFHCSGKINGCLVNGSSPFLIKFHLSWNLNCLHTLADVFQKSLNAYGFASLLTVNSCIKVRLDLQADKSPVVVKGPFFPRVVNPRYRIRGTNVWSKSWSSKAKQLQSSVKETLMHLDKGHETNLIY
jgi:hypothetical protein